MGHHFIIQEIGGMFHRVWVLSVHCTLQLVYRTIDTPTTTTTEHSAAALTMVELFAITVAWLVCFKPPHPREPLWKGLTEGGVAGFYMVL